MSLKPERKPPSKSPRPRAPGSRAPSSRPRSGGAVELQLAIGRVGLGIELTRAASLGPLTVTELALGLPVVRFPVDVSGGVRRFRHRRGTLERLTVELRRVDLVRAWAPRLAGLLSRGIPELAVLPRPYGATVTIVDAESERVLAFDVTLLTENADLVVVPFAPRGLGLPRPAIELAATALGSLVGGIGTRRGATLRIERAYGRIARALLPEAGARAPDADHVRTAALTPAGDAWILQGFRDALEPEHPAAALRALELALHLADGDDALLAGDSARARVLYLHALTRLPRHPEAHARVAELDRLVVGREEAARGTLDDAASAPESAWLRADLLERAGEREAARHAFLIAAEIEPVAVLAAFGLARAGALTDKPLEAAALFDAAVARAPTHPALRQHRIQSRLALGRLRDALADVEELEALTRGHRARHAVWMRAAHQWLDAGRTAEARALFERALRFAPDEPRALAGLGVAMLAAGQPARAVQLLGRAFSLPAREPPPDAHRLAFAEALAGPLGDRAGAVARLGEISEDSPEAALARGLEGKLRAELGDVGGASLAYARFRDTVLARPVPKRYKARVRELVLLAAQFEDSRDPLLAASHRALLADDARPEAPASPTIAPQAPAAEPPIDDDELAANLIARFRERPSDHSVVEKLADVLSRLGRSHELLAVLSARIEDAPAAVRSQLVPMQRDVLARLEREARERGHDHEAQLFRDALVALGGAIEP